MSPQPSDLDPAVKRFSGFAPLYNTYRPSPPDELLEVLMRLAKTDRPRLVVDLGCGTGLSTRPWARYAEQVVGVDPSEDMRRVAQEQTEAPNVSYRHGFGHETGLDGHSADIVTCSSSLHWMDPVSTFAEVGRILSLGGVFAAYGYDFPPTVCSWEIEPAYHEFKRKCQTLSEERQVPEAQRRLSWPDIEPSMRASGRFRHVKRISLHNTLSWNADDYIGWVLSEGGVKSRLKAGVTETEIGLDDLRNDAKRLLGDERSPCLFSYWVKIGIV